MQVASMEINDIFASLDQRSKASLVDYARYLLSISQQRKAAQDFVNQLEQAHSSMQELFRDEALLESEEEIQAEVSCLRYGGHK